VIDAHDEVEEKQTFATGKFKLKDTDFTSVPKTIELTAGNELHRNSRRSVCATVQQTQAAR